MDIWNPFFVPGKRFRDDVRYEERFVFNNVFVMVVCDTCHVQHGRRRGGILTDREIGHG